jgi:UDP-N-acetylglucosamine--N-acetylmuramyl-(pentapeptide) pyrophosphoryl-undecaprenol N-acetylglucosamine transferase
VAGALRARIPDVQFVFFTTSRPIDNAILGAQPVVCIPQPVRRPQKAPWTWFAFAKSWRASVRLCRGVLAQHAPLMVIGSGGYASAPPLRTAQAMGIPTALLNPDAIPGRANRLLGRRANLIFAQWEDTRQSFHQHPGFCVTGCPVRPEFQAAVRARGIARFGLDPQQRTLLVTGASQGARTINDAVVALAREIVALAGWQVLHLTGTADLPRMLDSYRAALGSEWVTTVTDDDARQEPRPSPRHGGPVAGGLLPRMEDGPGAGQSPTIRDKAAKAGARVRVVAYTKHMADALAAADLVIARAGASTLAELTALGRASILLPYPFHRDQHQLANARVLVRAGAARLVRDRIDPAGNAAALRSVLLPLMDDEFARERMAAAARRIGVVDAAGDIARRIQEWTCGQTHARTPAPLPAPAAMTLMAAALALDASRAETVSAKGGMGCCAADMSRAGE